MIKHFFQKIKSVHTLHTYFHCTLFLAFLEVVFILLKVTMQLVASYFYALSFDFISIEKILYLLYLEHEKYMRLFKNYILFVNYSYQLTKHTS